MNIITRLNKDISLNIYKEIAGGHKVHKVEYTYFNTSKPNENFKNYALLFWSAESLTSWTALLLLHAALLFVITKTRFLHPKFSRSYGAGKLSENRFLHMLNMEWQARFENT
jgi:hypothetical protein